jgi:hypothetical protein
MFGWFRKKTPPPELAVPPPPQHRGDVRVAFTNGRRSWTEETNLFRLMTEVLRARGHVVEQREDHVEHVESGFRIVPNLENFKPLDRGGVQTVTTVRVTHPRLVPDGLFEFQHSTGDNIETSFRDGFDNWAQMDFATLLEATRTKPKQCMAMEMKFPAEGDTPPRVRRIVFGPVMHFRSNPPAEAAAKDEGSDHDFCPCCLFVQSLDAFKPLVDKDGFFGVRLYAMRDENGEAGADCRINGEDFEDGKAALRAYVARWPQAGVEFRKQYVVVQTIDDKGDSTDGSKGKWRS